MNETLAHIGETGVLERILSKLPADPAAVCGPGDDCAVIKISSATDEELALTSDPVIEGTHFNASDAPWKTGRKAVGRALSDLAAMGSIPGWALINIAAPPDTPSACITGFYDGILSLSQKYGLVISGGDISESPVKTINVFAVGRLPAGSAVLRSGASPGDEIFVTGLLGAGRAGKHFMFDPRVHEGIFLRDYATSMIDITDGLLADLARLMHASRTGSRINPDLIPISPEAGVDDNSRSPLQHAMWDGEDFELLFTIKQTEAEAFKKAWRKHFEVECSHIGNVTEAEPLIDVVDSTGIRHEIENRGFFHFQKSRDSNQQ